MTNAHCRVLVTGASGHIGANLVRALIRSGAFVRAMVHRNSVALRGLNVELAVADVSDPSTLPPVFRDVDVVYHCAGCISISRRACPGLFEVNVTGTANIVEACLKAGVKRLVHFSSIHARSDTGPGTVIDEETPLALGDSEAPYDRSKAEGEWIVLCAANRGLDAVVVVPTAVLGPHDYLPSYFGRVLLSLARERMPVIVCGGFDWVDVCDVVDGAMRAAERAASGSRYVLSGHWCTLTEIAMYVSDARGCSPPRLCVPDRLARACGRVNEAICRLRGVEALFTGFSVEALSHHRNVSHEKASHDLGYRPRPLRETVTDTIHWFEQSGYLPLCQYRTH